MEQKVEKLEDIELYKKMLMEHKELSLHRKKYNKYLKLTYACGIFAFLAMFLFSKSSLQIIPTIISAILTLIFFVLFQKERYLYYNIFKVDVISEIMSNERDRYEYEAEGLDEEIYKKADFGFEIYNKYYAEDALVATINDRKYIISDVKTIGINSDGDEVALFKGVVAYYTLKKKIPGTITIDVKDKTSKLKKDYVPVDNEIFSTTYEMLASDKHFASKHINDKIIDRVINILLVYRKVVELKIIDDSVIIRLNDIYLFDADIKDVMKEAENIATTFKLVDEVKKLMEDIAESINK